MEINTLTKEKQSVLSAIGSGFTLIELLIVIAIVGILVSISVVSYTLVQKQSRDQRRRSDLKAIQNAWEQYYADYTNTYPSSCSVSTVYLPAGLPADPKAGTSYAKSCTSTTYCFCAAIESGSGNSDGVCNFSASSKTYYCVSNLQ